MRRRSSVAAIPAWLAVFDPSEWDSRVLSEGEAAAYRFGLPADEAAWQRLFRSRWLQARADWAQVNAPAAWGDLLADVLSFPV